MTGSGGSEGRRQVDLPLGSGFPISGDAMVWQPPQSVPCVAVVSGLALDCPSPAPARLANAAALFFGTWSSARQWLGQHALHRAAGCDILWSSSMSALDIVFTPFRHAPVIISPATSRLRVWNGGALVTLE